MTAFFVPELGSSDGTAEEAYAGIRADAEALTGLTPRKRRIQKVMCRRGGVDCEAEVGLPDPIEGATVLAILDLGKRLPFVIRLGSPDGGAASTQVIVNSVYSVTEFTG